MITANLY